MDQLRVEKYLDKRGMDKDQRLVRDNGGQYLKNFLVEFAAFVKQETLTEVTRSIKLLR